jgi:hypothetical protein
MVFKHREKKMLKAKVPANYISLSSYADLKNLGLAWRDLMSVGKVCHKYCREEGIPTYQVESSKNGRAATLYPKEVLERFLG